MFWFCSFSLDDFVVFSSFVVLQFISMVSLIWYGLGMVFSVWNRLAS